MVTLQPIGSVSNARQVVEDDNWGGLVSEIAIEEPMGTEGLAGSEEFSHAAQKQNL
jgi:hypothetical protein